MGTWRWGCPCAGPAARLVGPRPLSALARPGLLARLDMPYAVAVEPSATARGTPRCVANPSLGGGLSANGIRLRLCVARLRVCLGRIRRVSCVRCELLAVRAQEPPRAPNQRSTLGTRFTRNLDFGFEVRGERGRRVCRTSCVCVCGLMLSSVYFVYCACGCARYIVFLYVCFMCVY
jgi:hypothetical protein